MRSAFSKENFLLVACSGLGAFLAFILIHQCTYLPWGAPANYEYTRFCYNDIQALYGARHLELRNFPYVVQEGIEYPPLIGLNMWLASLFARDHVSYFYANIPFHLLFLALCICALLKLVPSKKKVLWFVLGPPLIEYLFLNWDISTVAVTLLALVFLKEKKFFLTALMIGLGMAGKMYPALLVPPLIVSLCPRSKAIRGRELLQVVAGLFIGWGVLNLPIALADQIRNGTIDHWRYIFSFHSQRTPGFESVWYWVAEAIGYHPTDPDYRMIVDRGSILFLAGFTLLVLFRQRKKTQSPIPAFAAILSFVLLISKVHSPQYALWLLPFFSILATPLFFTLGYLLSEMLVHFTVFHYFCEMNSSPNPWEAYLSLSVLFRAAALGCLSMYWGFICRVEKSPGYDIGRQRS